MTPNRLHTRPIFNAALAPWERILDSPVYAKMVAAIAASASMIRGDVLFLILVALLFANLWDTLLGREAARRRKEEVSSDTARAGFLTKMTGFVYILLVRVIEHWGQENGIPGLEFTRGALAAGMTMTLLLMEMESIEGHRIDLGARPIPAFSALIRTLRTVEGRLLAALNPVPPAPATPEPTEDP